MNFLIRYFVDGTAFFVGTATLLVLPLLPAVGKAWGARLVRMGAVLGAAVVALSGTPLPFWLYGIWAAGLVFWEVIRRRQAKLPVRLALACRLLPPALALAAAAMELPWQINPSIVIGRSQAVYVIGDSISAGLDPSRQGAWPELLAHKIDANVVNLAQAGAKVGGAAYQAGGVQEPSAIVLVEIGGNDLMLTPAGAFEADLEKALQIVQGPQRRVFLIEMPSLPFGNFHGLAQRRLARKYGVAMIPRRLLVNVWATPGATLDGIHLSPAGHEQMATAIARLFTMSGGRPRGSSSRLSAVAGDGGIEVDADAAGDDLAVEVGAAGAGEAAGVGMVDPVVRVELDRQGQQQIPRAGLRAIHNVVRYLQIHAWLLPPSYRA